MALLHPDVVVLAMEGYTASLNDVKPNNQEPLYTWEKNHMTQSLMWKSSALKPHYFGFWVTELAIYKDGTIQHIIPGAHVVTYPSSKSQRAVNYHWKEHHQRYVFKSDDIQYTQKDIQRMLKSIPRRSLIYYKGGNIVSSIVSLLHLNAINIEDRGIQKIGEGEVQRYQTLDFCKVHVDSLCHCPKAQVQYYIDHVSEWYHPMDCNEDRLVEEMRKSMNLDEDVLELTDPCMTV